MYMSYRLIFLLIYRYLFGIKNEKNSSIVFIVCFIAIFIASFALALIASIMSGFEKATHTQLQGIHAQIIMHSPHYEVLNGPLLKEILNNEFSEISSLSMSSTQQVILQKNDINAFSIPVLLKAIEPEQEEKTTRIGQKIVNSEPSKKTLKNLLQNRSIIIGKKLAQQLDIKEGESLAVYYWPEQEIQNTRIKLEKANLLVSGFFNTGIEEFDTGVALTTFDTLLELFPDSGPTQINIKLKTAHNEQKVIEKLKNRFKLEAFSWLDLYPSLISALKLEKYAMFFIVCLIMLIASMNIISLLMVQIIKKRADIGILLAMGVLKKNITLLFMAIGFSLCVSASSLGLFCAFIVGIILKYWAFIQLPDSYYFSKLPIAMDFFTFAFIFFLITIVGLIASYIPCRNIKTINTVSILRFEQ